ncbi:MAG: excisionase family DNA binding protein [Candidatus Omnitrophota bacterium]|jgi:excisionase family DNA binding protein
MKSDIPEPKFLSVPEAAKVCGVSRNTVYMWVRQGKLGAYQTPGRTNLIRPSDLVKFMEENGMFVPNTLIEMAREDVKLMGGESAPNMGASTNDTMCNVLVVDDDPMSRSLAVRALKEIGQVYQAETGFEALHLLTLHKQIDIIMLDLRMPGQHGLETLTEIKRIRPEASVIIISGFASDIPDDQRNGAITKILEKPITIQQLQDAIVEVNESRLTS